MVMSMQIYTANLGVQLFLFTVAAVTFLRFALLACCMETVWSAVLCRTVVGSLPSQIGYLCVQC